MRPNPAVGQVWKGVGGEVFWIAVGCHGTFPRGVSMPSRSKCKKQKEIKQ